jgi:hypothetical protein
MVRAAANDIRTSGFMVKRERERGKEGAMCGQSSARQLNIDI